MKPLLALVAYLVVFNGIAVQLNAATISLLPTHDNGMFGPNSPNNSTGGGQHFFVGGTRAYRGLIEFDLSSVPAGTTINSATLTMYMDRASGAATINIMLQKLTASWGEGTSGASGTDLGIRGGGGMGATGTENDATWTARIVHSAGNTNWSTAGGDYVASPSATAGVGGGMSTNGTAPLKIDWTGAGMVSDIQAWIADGSSNFGWLIKGTEQATDGDNPRRFMAVENYFNGSNPRMNYDSTGTIPNDGTLTPDFRPHLVVDFTPAPEPGSAMLALAGIGSLTYRKRR